MNLTDYSYRRTIPGDRDHKPEVSPTDRIGKLLRKLDNELNEFVPENANSAFIVAIHTARLAIKGLKSFF